jgi:hypothetical protein
MNLTTPYGTRPIGAAIAQAAQPATMERFLLLSPRDSDAATLSASSAVASLPVTNLQTIQPAQVWRSADNAPQTIDVAFPSAVAANALALVATNVSGAALVRIRAAVLLSDVEASPALDTGWQPLFPPTGRPIEPDWPSTIGLRRWTNDTAYRFWRVEIADGLGAVSYIEAGRLVLGRAWQPTQNLDLGGTPFGFAPADVQLASTFGRTFTNRRSISPPRLFEISVFALNKREAFDGIFELQRLRGLWGDVVCALDPGEGADFHRFTMQGVFTAGGAYTLPPAFDDAGSMFGAAIKLREFI